MTENETIELLNSFYEMDEMYAAAQVAIKALEEIQQYRAIGTVEDIADGIKQSEEEFNMLMEYLNIGTIDEFKTLKEKSVAKKPIIKPWSDARCPSCGCSLSESLGDGYYRHFESMDRCYCGQKLDWE